MGKKRAAGEGTIYPTKNGKFRTQITVPGGKRLSHTGPTEKEVMEWKKRKLAELEKGLNYDAARTSVKKFMDNWLASRRPSLRPNTYIQYEQIARDYILPYIGNIKLGSLRPDQVQAMYDHLLQTGASARTVELTHSVLHNMLSHALRLGVVYRNVCDLTMPARPEEKEKNILTDDQVQRLLTAIEGERNEALVYMAIMTGMRLGELLGLMWIDLDWLTGEIQIRRQAQRGAYGDAEKFAPPKTRRSRRTIVVGERMLDILREQDRRIQLQRQVAGERWTEMGLIFPSTFGSPQMSGNFHRDWKRLQAKAGIKCRFHDLRHLAASVLLVKLKKSPTEVSAILGHSKTSTTLDIYGHMLPGMGAETARQMEDQVIPTKVDIPQKEPKG